MNAQTWYQTLQKPSWAPNSSVFGQVWTPLYIIIATVNIVVLHAVISGKLAISKALPFWINLAANIAFTPIQFGLRNNWLALIDITIVLITIIWAMVAIWSYNRLLSIAFIPYLVWVVIATTLQVSIVIMN
jgi:tryptophan-rich sensory protein